MRNKCQITNSYGQTHIGSLLSKISPSATMLLKWRKPCWQIHPLREFLQQLVFERCSIKARLMAAAWQINSEVANTEKKHRSNWECCRKFDVGIISQEALKQWKSTVKLCIFLNNPQEMRYSLLFWQWKIRNAFFFFHMT